MIRFVTIATFAASLLLWSTPIFADSPNVSSDEATVMADAVLPVQHQHVHQHAPLSPFPVLNNLGNNLGINSERIGRFGAGMVGRLRNAASFPLVATGIAQQPGAVPGAMPMPAGSPPNGFIGGVFSPQQYQQVPPHPMMMAGYAPPMGPGGYPPVAPLQGGEIPLPELIDPNGYAYPGSMGYMGENSIPDQRIVYVPYAMPPPIHVERLAKALPRPPIMRRVLGDSTLYEYPEMPMRMYTTRGPRDFLATNPPSIGY